MNEAPRSFRSMKCYGNGLSRRGVLRVGFLGGLGLSLADMLRFEALAEQKHYDS